MRRARLFGTSLVGGLAGLLLMTACTAEPVPGTPGPATVQQGNAGVPGGQSGQPTQPSRAQPGPSSDGPLVDGVVADECLLTSAEVSVLVGRAVQALAQTDAPRSDGLRVPSCVATARGASVLALNVYGIDGRTPAEHIRAVPFNAGRRELTGVGEAAAVVRTSNGTVLQLARGPFLVTVNVLRGSPSDAALRVAGNAALARLPS